MAKTEKRTLKAVVADLCEVADEWRLRENVVPGGKLHAVYVEQLRKLLAESKKCDR